MTDVGGMSVQELVAAADSKVSYPRNSSRTREWPEHLLGSCETSYSRKAWATLSCHTTVSPITPPPARLTSCQHLHTEPCAAPLLAIAITDEGHRHPLLSTHLIQGQQCAEAPAGWRRITYS
jgi:hypothetical protein